MRNLIKILLMATFILGLVACGGQKKQETQEQTVTTQTAQPDTAKADTTQADTTQVQE